MNRTAFTLLELMTVVVIIIVLAALLIPVVQGMRGRAQKAQCMANLKQLHVATELYLQNNNSVWPQMNPKDLGNVVLKGKVWLYYLKPYGITAKNWQCPTLRSKNTQLTDQDFDYQSAAFSRKPRVAYKWATQPWFVEIASIHGNGQLIVFTDGSIHELNDLLPKR